MHKRWTLCLLTLALAWSSNRLQGQPATPAPRLDQYGDPLPEHAIVRFGTIRLRAYVQRFAFAPDGKTFASAGDDWDPSIRIWDVATGKELRQWLAHTGTILSLSYIAKGEKLASVGSEGTLHIWDESTGRQSRTVGLGIEHLSSAVVVGDGDSLVTVGDDGTVRVHDFLTGKETASLGHHRAAGVRVVLCANGSRFGVVGTNDTVALWDIATAKQLSFVTPGQKTSAKANANTVALSPDGTRIAVVGSGSPVIVEWDVDTGKEIGRYQGAAGAVNQLAYSPDGRRFAANNKGVLRVWGVATHQGLRQLDVGTWGVKNTAFSPDGKLLAAVQGALIRLWDLRANKALDVYDGPGSRVNDLAFTADGRSVLACEFNGTVRRFSVANGVESASWKHPVAANYKMLALQGGNGVLAPSSQKIIRMDLGDASGTARTLVNIPKVTPTCRAVSPDGKVVAATGSDSVVRFWDTETGLAKGQLPTSTTAYKGYAFSPDGALFAESAIRLPVSIWNVATGKLFSQINVKNDIRLGNGGRFTQAGADFVAFAPDGKTLLTTAPQGFLWEVGTGGLRVDLKTTSVQGEALHYGYCGAFSPDGCLLALGTSDRAVLLIETATGKQLARLEGHHGAVVCLAFAPNGKTLASGGEDASVVVWDVAAMADRSRPAPTELKPDQVRALWLELADTDAAKAYKAICALAAAPKHAPLFMKTRLMGADQAQSEQIAKCISYLDDAKFKVREKAYKELAAFEDLATSQLLKVLKTQPSAEVRSRVETLLGKLKPANAQVRIDRALEALERSGAKEAVAALEDLAKQADEGLKRKASAVLGRLSKRGG